MDRTLQPAFQKSSVFVLPTAERIQGSGIGEIIYLPSDFGEVVKIEVVFQVGRYDDTVPGVAHFTAKMLNKGVVGKDANQIANTLDYFGAQMSSDASFDFTSITLYALRKNLHKLLPLFLSLTSEPTFPEVELNNFRRIFVENLKVSLEKNDYVGSCRIGKKVFGNHPYGKTVEIEDAEKINVQFLKTFFKDHFKPFKVFVTGAIEPSDLEFLLKNIAFGTELITGNNFSLSPESPSTEEIEGPNKVQASIKMARRTIPRSHPDVPGLQLANHLLGGFFGSRLMKNIREEKGLTYGIHSYLQNHSRATVLNISADVNAEKSGIALEEIKKEIERLPDVSENELEIAKNHFIGSFQNEITTVFEAAQKIKTLILHGLPLDYYQKLVYGVSEVKPSDIDDITQKYLKADGFSTVVVK
jgi:zinc protease